MLGGESVCSQQFIKDRLVEIEQEQERLVDELSFLQEDSWITIEKQVASLKEIE